MKRIMSLFVAFCFLTNNISFALCPALISGDLGGETYHHLFLKHAEIGLQKALKTLDGLSEIKGCQNKEKIKKVFARYNQLKGTQTYHPEETRFNPLEVKAYFNLLDQVGKNNNIFVIPVSVTKFDAGKENSENYRLLFSTVYDKVNKGFPVFYCTEEEFKKHEASIALRNALPVRNKKDNAKLKKSMFRNTLHNDEIDRFLDKRIKEGNFTEFKGRADKDLEWDKKYPDRKKPAPGTYVSKKCLDYIRTEIDKFLEFAGLGITFDDAFENKNLVFIRVTDESEWPVIPEKEREEETDLRVTSHSSENAAYKLLIGTDFNKLIEESPSEDKVKRILDEIIVDWIHETGASYNLTWWVGRRSPAMPKTTINDLDLLYTEYTLDHSAVAKPSERKNYIISKFRKGRANLNHLFADGIYRDHAMGKEELKPEYVRARRLLGKKLASAIYKGYKVAKKKGIQLTIDKLIESYNTLLESKKKAKGGLLDDTKKSLLRTQTWLEKYIFMGIVHILTTYGRGFPETKDLDINPMLFDTITPALHDSRHIAARQEAIYVLRSVLTDPSSDLIPTLKETLKSLKKLSTIKLSEFLKDVRNEETIRKNIAPPIKTFTHKVLEKYYGTKDPAVELETISSIEEHLTLIKNEKDNSYRQAVEADIAVQRKAGKIDKAKMVPEAVKKLLNEWRTHKSGKSFEDMVLAQIFVGDASKLGNLMGDYFNNELPSELQDWIREKYCNITGLDAYTAQENKSHIMFSKNLNVTMELMLYVTDCLKEATEINIFTIQDAFYASTRMKEKTHVCRAIKQKDSDAGFYIGDKLYKKLSGDELHEKSSRKEYNKNFALFCFNEVQHKNNFEVRHHPIKRLEDITTANDHVVIDNLKEFEYDYIETELKPWGELLPGGIIGQGERMKTLFERVLEPFARSGSQSTLLITGATGAGKTQAADAVREMMGIPINLEYSNENNVFTRLSCADLLSMTEQEIRKTFLGTSVNAYSQNQDRDKYKNLGVLQYLVKNVLKVAARTKNLKNNQALLVIDDLSYAAGDSEKAKTIQGLLNTILEDSKLVQLENGETLNISNIKIIGIANGENLDNFPPGLKRRFNIKARIPDLSKRGDDIMRIAERINFEESKKTGIPYSGFDEKFGGFIRSWAEKPGNKIQVGDLKNFVKNLIMTRAYLLKKFRNGEHFPDTNMDGESILFGTYYKKEKNEAIWYTGNSRVVSLKKIKKIFSPYLITITDFLYSTACRESFINSLDLTMEQIEEKYDPVLRKENPEPLYAYFKDKLQPKDLQGNYTSFYAGPAGEQPGMKDPRDMGGKNSILEEPEDEFSGMMKVLSRIPDEYTTAGVDNETLAEALQDALAPVKLESTDLDPVLEYVKEFFEKLFRGNCEVEIEIPEDAKEYNTELPTLPGVDYNYATNGKVIVNVSRQDEITEMPSTQKYQFTFDLTLGSKKNVVGKISSLNIDVTPGDTKKTMNFSYTSTTGSLHPKIIMQKMQQIAISMSEDKTTPKWAQHIIASNIIDFSKLETPVKSVLIFSPKVTFDKGVGYLLPKLERAGIPIAVVTETEWQKKAIKKLNKEEKVNIICLDHLGDAFQAIPAKKYYYFKIDEDEDMGKIDGIIPCDITGKVALIVQALAKAHHIDSVDTINFMKELAEQFSHSV